MPFDMTINKTNKIYSDAVNFIKNGQQISMIRFNSQEMKKRFESLEKEEDCYFKKLVEFVRCLATCLQYLSALHNKPINSLKKIVSVAMIDSGYDRELLPHSLNLLKEFWLFGDRIDD